MWLRNRLVLPVILSSLAILAGCGSGVSNPTPPPGGSFSNTNFNGVYTFSVLGSDPGNLGTGSQFAMAGSLTACGCTAGNISGGTVDLADNTGTAPAAAIGSNSKYSISKDGRGFAQLMITPTGGSQFEVDVDFVLTSSSHGLISRFDGGGTGSGTIDSQNLVGQATMANFPLAYSLSGADLAGNPLAQVGAFTLDGSGNILTSGANAGVADTTIYNLGTLTATPFPKSVLSGWVQVGSGTDPGPASLTTSFGTLTFDVYVVDSSHLKLIENDGIEILVGDVFTQTSATIPAGNLVFSMVGPDPGGNPFAAAGVMVSDGTSIPSGAEDLNDNGNVDFGSTTPQAFTGGFVATGGGRFAVTLTTFAGGTNFAAYPSDGGLLLLEIDGGAGSGVTGGVALAQATGASIAASQGYGMNLTGIDLFNFVEVDQIAEFKTTSTNMTGLIDSNDGGVLNTSNLNGSYTAGSDGLGSATFGNNNTPTGIFFYSVDSSTALVLSTDSNAVEVGLFEVQATPTQSALARPRTLPMIGSVVRPHAAAARSKVGFVRK